MAAGRATLSFWARAILIHTVVIGAVMVQASLQQESNVRTSDTDYRSEESALSSAKQESEDTARAAKLEAFIERYPNSSHEEDALEVLLDTYERHGTLNEIEKTADRLLLKDPDNLMGLWNKAKLFYVGEADLQKNLDLAKRGLRILQTVSQQEKRNSVKFSSQRSEMNATFNGVAGAIALRMKDFQNAQMYLRSALESDPNNLGNAYQLALAYLTSTPPEPSQGLFFLARALNLASASERTELDAYGKEQCVKYYDSDRSWTSVKSLARTHTTPPGDFQISK